MRHRRHAAMGAEWLSIVRCAKHVSEPVCPEPQAGKSPEPRPAVISPAWSGPAGGVVITGLLNKIMAASSRLSPTPPTLRIANWMMSTREVRSNRSPSITAAA